MPTAVGTRRDLAFHPVGFAWPDPSPDPPVRSYRTLSPLAPTGRLPFVYGRDVRTCKPNSVCSQRLRTPPRGGRHLSGTAVAGPLERPTCAAPRSSERWRAPPCRPLSAHGATWPYTPWGLPGRSRRRDRRCALTAPFHPLSRQSQNEVPASGRDCSLLHVPSAPRRYRTSVRSVGHDAAFPLGSTGPVVFGLSSPPVPTASAPTERQPNPHVIQ